MTSEKIRIIHMDDDMVVVNKPASIPVRFVFFFPEVRFDLKFEFLEIMKLKSDSDAGSVRNGALRKLGGAEQPPKKLPRA